MDSHSCFQFEKSVKCQPTTRLRELLVGGAIHTCRTLEDKDSFSHFFKFCFTRHYLTFYKSITITF